MDHDLLADQLLTWRTGAGDKGRTTLPGLLSLIAGGQVEDFPRVRAHQFRPWMMFLAQLAAAALRRAGRQDPKVSEREWERLLLALSNGNRAPWCLIVDDLLHPAFLQPPVPEGSVQTWKRTLHPDDLDVLVTAKVHDVKTSLIPPDDYEAWVYALVTLQTMEGFLGQGNYGIVRMNGGFANRPYLGLAEDMGVCSAFRRDVTVLLATWDDVLDREHFSDHGLSLLWTMPWDGMTSLTPEELAPHFIEICRRVRLEAAPEGLCCRRASSKVKRALPTVAGGDVGDPWIPVRRTDAESVKKKSGKGKAEGSAVLSVSERGFDYQLLSELLLIHEEYQAAPASLPRQGDRRQLLLSAWALVRGQGRTDGLRERTVVVEGAVRARLQQDDGRQAIGRRAKDWIGIAQKMRTKVLFPALKRLALGDSVPEDRFSSRLDEIFFDQLFGSVEAADDDARMVFERVLAKLARMELQHAIDTTTVPEAQRLCAVSEAEGLFNGCLRKQFGDIANAGDCGEGATT